MPGDHGTRDAEASGVRVRFVLCQKRANDRLYSIEIVAVKFFLGDGFPRAVLRRYKGEARFSGTDVTRDQQWDGASCQMPDLQRGLISKFMTTLITKHLLVT
jgi:hypothetical protein